MLTSVQKEILQSLINLYRNADASIKGEEIAMYHELNFGTIEKSDAVFEKFRTCKRSSWT